jgi:threonine 3-dehydrogenase
MRALYKAQRGPGLELREVPEPITGERDVKVKVLKTGICGTDLHIESWDSRADTNLHPPFIPGHEFVGRVCEIGSDVTSIKVGDLVSGEGHIVCGRCRNCLAGRSHLCPHTKGVGVNRNGAFAEYLAIPVSNIWHASPRISDEILAIFDPFGNATHTALSFNLVGEDVLVTGAGPIGILAAAIAKKAGARFVVITDVNPYRLELAKKFNIDRAVNVSKETLADVQKDLGMKEGFDVGLEMSGNGAALNSMIDAMCHGGKIAQLGILPDNTVIDWNKLTFNGLTIKGIYGREMYETWYKMSAMVESGLDISPIITHRFHYTEFEKGFEAMRSGNSGKVILSWE